MRRQSFFTASTRSAPPNSDLTAKKDPKKKEWGEFLQARKASKVNTPRKLPKEAPSQPLPVDVQGLPLR